MPETIRKFWGPSSGRATFNYNWPIIDQDSTVIVTASEYNAERVRFLGSASVTVSNIAPHGPPYDPNHGVTFVVDVDWGSPINLVTDITVLDGAPVEVDLYTPPVPRNIGLRMQYQESSEWCWIANGASINAFYNPASTVTQCQIMTIIGHNINKFPANTGACPTAAALAANPALAAKLANPYAIAALYALDGAPPGVDPVYLKTGGVGDALNVNGNWAGSQPASLTLAQVASEVSAGRPVVATIAWNSNGAEHFVSVAGVSGDILLILDPINGQSVIPFEQFPAQYFGGAKLVGWDFTKA